MARTCSNVVLACLRVDKPLPEAEARRVAMASHVQTTRA